ncbi:hypothetical protein [Kribbella soli]|uniref:hypothetical protein n=1 Tax=Kribbella soli TaxID=1124743 RepID=UPI0013F3EAB9|nr:hypothetical protein [Kribbella soli]
MLDEAPPGVSETDVRELVAVADHIMQPSEPFDARWRSEWQIATNHLRRLREMLIAAAT